MSEPDRGDARSQAPIDFMGARRLAGAVSIALVLIAIAALAIRGLNFGLDFTGGTMVEVEFPQATDPQAVRATLAEAGFRNAVVQNFGTPRDILVRLPPQPERARDQVGNQVVQLLRANISEAELRRSEFVGPAVGEQLREQGGLAMLTALAVVMIYVMFRFTGKFALGAVVALIHDVLVVLGAFALFQWTFDLPVLAAVLAVIGYSLNDTIVVSDRVRENFRRIRRIEPHAVINVSLNQMIGRTLVTSLTTLLVLVALRLFGGELIAGFSTALILGVTVGTYSSIYVAANVLMVLNINREDLLLPEKEGATDDGRP